MCGIPKDIELIVYKYIHREKIKRMNKEYMCSFACFFDEHLQYFFAISYLPQGVSYRIIINDRDIYHSRIYSRICPFFKPRRYINLEVFPRLSKNYY